MNLSNSKPQYFNITISVQESEKSQLLDQLLEQGALCVSDPGIPNELVILSTDPNLLSDTFTQLKCEQVSDWEYKWMDTFTGHFLTENTYILPESKECPDTISAKKIILLDPRDAFGDGNHPTTQLCAEALEKACSKANKKESCIDLGTGTGVLAILAKKLGFKDVEATDIEPSSIHKAQKNCTLNQCNDIQIYLSDILKNPPIKTYDIIIANVLTHILLESLDNLKKCLTPTSIMILSGIGSQWKKEFDEALINAKLSTQICTEKEGWLCYTLCLTTPDSTND